MQMSGIDLPELVVSMATNDNFAFASKRSPTSSTAQPLRAIRQLEMSNNSTSCGRSARILTPLATIEHCPYERTQA